MRDSLRMITNDAAGIAASGPLSRCVADHGVLLEQAYLERNGILTDIAPGRCYVRDIIRPNDRV